MLFIIIINEIFFTITVQVLIFPMDQYNNKLQSVVDWN